MIKKENESEIKEHITHIDNQIKNYQNIENSSSGIYWVMHCLMLIFATQFQAVSEILFKTLGSISIDKSILLIGTVLMVSSVLIKFYYDFKREKK